MFDRPKQGFAIPLRDWFRGTLRHRIEALTGAGAIADYVHAPALRRTVAEHTSGRRDHSLALWRLIVLEAWLGALSDGSLERPPAVPAAPA